MAPPTVLFVDTMIVIEAVRTGIWRAITGQRRVVTVEECAEELLRGGPETVSGYIVVTPDDISRMNVEPLSGLAAAEFRLVFPGADGLDPGERALLAFARKCAESFELCCCDKAAVTAARALGFLDSVVSLEAIAKMVGARPNPQLKQQYTEARMAQWRVSLELGRPI